MTEPAQPPAVPDELVERAWAAAVTAGALAGAFNEFEMRAGLAAVADGMEAKARRECAAEVQPIIAQLYEIECYGPAGRLEALTDSWAEKPKSRPHRPA